uniref:Complex III subunit 3 n=1 Tax=Angiostrongylus cantonensis TaxID=6313 RepID=A0A0K0DJ49_ANGCA
MVGGVKFYGMKLLIFKIKNDWTPLNLTPWLLLVLVVVHMIFLHSTGRTSSLYCHGDYDKISFGPYYWNKDFYNLLEILKCLLRHYTTTPQTDTPSPYI